MTTRLPALLILLFAMPSAFADGKVFSTQVALPVQLPDQRALIAFKDGVETLVIETSFVGGGAELAWVVPLPARPSAITKAIRGLFPTLSLLCEPRLIEMSGLGAVLWLEVFAIGFMLARKSKHPVAGVRGLALSHAGDPVRYSGTISIGTAGGLP